MTAWISVKERLPETGHRVLVSTSHGQFVLGYQEWAEHWNDHGGYFCPKEHVTHWQPLPEPPDAEDA